MGALRKGDKVGWTSRGGTAHGVAGEKRTGSGHVKSHRLATSLDNLEYLVRTNEVKMAVHRPSAVAKARNHPV